MDDLLVFGMSVQRIKLNSNDEVEITQIPLHEFMANEIEQQCQEQQTQILKEN